MAIPNQIPGQPIEHPHAMLVLFLGIGGILCCGVLGPVAWAMGKRSLDQIEESGGAYGGRAQVLVGYILGIITTVFMIILALVFLLMLIGGNA
ncbi:DUF4190 domain-containing protein [Nocardia arthritidis]|uniref:DUF4190 domain-containing protein n=1 Tax=Nocardia arthritidis TaxID=228602 RepID=A0A6G9Y5R8_9NOCA|nr:DUF4190 domain-containing protein [Nocardia arthritidis]QIS08416.1 DUF4190 domain-containing protein [Nocardia arthritidis]